MPEANLLVVDDDPGIRQILTDSFAREGYAVLAVSSVRQAMAAADGKRIDVALIDVRLPDENGLVLLRGLKQTHPGVICILITGDPSLESAITALDSGADGYLLKPLRPLSLILRVKEAIGQKKLASELQRTNENLAEAQRIAKLGIRDHDLVSGAVSWSGEAFAIFGHDPADGPLTHEKAIGRVHPDDREAFAAWSRSGSGQGAEKTIEYRLQCADGGIRIIQEQGRIISDSTGRPARVLFIFRDVTEEKKLKQESAYRLQQVIHADKLASLGEVVAGVAHEINNPNSFISYNAPLLEETWEMLSPIIADFAAQNPGWRRGNLTIDELRQDMLDIIQAIKTGSDRIKKVVSHLKDFARMDDSTAMKPVQVNHVIENTLTIVGARVRKSVRRLDVDLASGLPTIPGHFQKLEQVVANLTLNAANAVSDMEKGVVCLRSRYIERIGCVLIEVEDNGRGMPREVMGRIFDPFFTTRRESGGTGLGLSVSYGLVREHNGLIGVLSHPGKGSRFTVYLPIHRDKKPDLRPAILCVDDDPQVLRMLQTFFVSVKNMSVAMLENSGEVIDYLRAHPEVDIILCDIWMPSLSGWDLYRQISCEFPLVTMVLYSGDRDVLDKRPEDVPPPEHFLRKPLGFQTLMTVIERIGRQRF